MKKFIPFLLSCLSYVVVPAQGWQPTHLTSANYLAITSTASHENQLYSVVFNGFTGEVYQLDASVASWTKVNLPQVPGIPQHLRSAGSRLYLSALDGLAGTLLHSSGVLGNFVVDTAGLPRLLSGIVPAIGMQYNDGQIYVNLGSSGYYFKDTTAIAWQALVTPTALNGGGDPIAFIQDSLFAYDNSGTTTLYVSGDQGQNWTTRTTDLPSNFKAPLMIGDPINGRLYVAGSKSDGSLYGVYYSDDHGHSWTKPDLDAFIGTDYAGGQQEVTTLLPLGDEIHLALENDAANSPPVMLHSSSGITNLAYDTVGFVNDPVGTIHGVQFLKHLGKTFLTLNVRDVYVKDGSGPTAIGGDHQAMHPSLRIYPNPASSDLNILGWQPGENHVARIYSLTGGLIQEFSFTSGSIDISSLPVGVYVLELVDNGQPERLKFIKN